MTDKKVKISSIIKNQLPEFVKEQYPLVEEFLSQYYKSIENQGNSLDLIQNLDQYIKIDNILPINKSTFLSSDVSFFDTVISVKSTNGFPDSYGLIKIDDEIITYTNKTSTTFEGCIRGFSGISSLKDPTKVDELVFTQTKSSEHKIQTEVINLSILFLEEFLFKIKKQVLPGFENIKLSDDINQNIFIKQSKDFYNSKGTDSSFKILFYALYGLSVEVIKPRDYLIQPSDAQYRITKNIVAELVSGNVEEIINGTLYQDEDDIFPGARGTITNIERIIRRNKDYYLISLDYDYDKDIDVTGSIKSDFKINPKTISTTNTFINSNYIDVDSTVGFPQSGELIIDLPNQTQLSVTYKSKTLNQFFECSGIFQNLPTKTDIRLNKFVYGFSFKNKNERIKFRITGVLSNLNILDKPSQYSKDDTIRIKTLGSDLKELKANNWFFNVATKYDVDFIELLDSSDYTYRVTLIDDHNFVIGDRFELTSSIGDTKSGKIIFVLNKKIVLIRRQGQLDETLKYIIKKQISKVDLINYSELNFYSSNVQNVYTDVENSIYVTSPSLPTYLDYPLKIEDEVITFFGNINGFDLLFRDQNGVLITHSYYTGDSVVYRPSNQSDKITDFGVYFVKRINENIIRLSKSREDLYNNQFISLNGNSIGDRIELFDFNDKNIQFKKIGPQGLVKNISLPVDDGIKYETNPGTTGIFINGVELLNYKSKDSLFYGAIEEIIPISGGIDYDVINPPTITVSDDTGVGCESFCSVVGSLDRIDILDPGFDYIEDPTIEIRGGNGTGASAKVNIVSYDHQESFNALSGVDINNNIITFLSYHKFRNNEEIIYSSEGNQPLFGLVENSSYFASVQDEYTIKLYKSILDSSVGINTINLINIGSGVHSFRSRNKKKKIGSIDIKNPGNNYTNKKTCVEGVGINTSLDILHIKKHGYNTGEIIKYYPTDVPIGGLTSSFSYYVNKLNDNEIQLSDTGSGDLPIDYYFRSKQFVDLTSTGSGEHFFNYEPIQVIVKGKIGISSVGNENFEAKIIPIFRGEIKSVFVKDGGSNYGSDEILNYNKQPQYNIESGYGAELIPIINDGKIVDIIIQSSGNDYNTIPDIFISGSGKGCILTPIITDGKITEVIIISSGSGYEKNNTFINIIPKGLGAKFEFKIKSWRVNLVERKLNSNKIPNDDGIIYSGSGDDFGLQYTHLYASRSLRSSVLSTKFENGAIAFDKDLQLLNGKEISSKAHSPIIGWAYDGNPIYGPYGFSTITGGSVILLKSGYNFKRNSILIGENRPDFSKYPIGFFVEDYEYTSEGDLDENNGRFSVTPEFPNGIYAYFSTFNTLSIESGGVFKNYRKPEFPYVIGNTYKSTPNLYNFSQINQSNIDLNQIGWIRNTTPYNLLNKNSGYDYIFNPNAEIEQLTDIKSTSLGSIDEIEILSSGDGYKVGDKVIFSDNKSKAFVSSIKGKKIKKINVNQVEINNIQLVEYNSYLGIKTDVSLLKNNDVVKITTPFEYNKNINIKVKNPISLTLSVGINSVNSTGILTTISISGFLDEDLIENDLFDINGETIQILEIDKKNNILKIRRNINNISGITSHPSGSILVEKSRKFITNLGLTTSYNLKRNKEYYFESNRVVGLGTTFGVGITSTQFLNVENFRSKVFVGSGSSTRLYFDRISEKSRYSLNNFVNIVESTDLNFNIEKSKVIGVGNTFIDIDFDTSSLSIGFGVTAFINKWKIVNVPTRTIRIEKHNLNLNDPITYHPPENGDPILVIDPKNINEEYPLPEDQILYSVPITEDLIGISTQPNSNISIDSQDLLIFSGFGSNDPENGKIHSFETVYNNTVKSKIIKNIVNVETEEPHNLKIGDSVSINCLSNTINTVKVKYNDYNRRLVIGELLFDGDGVSVSDNSITIQNHNLITGEKIIHESSTPCEGLIDQKIYYVYVLDQNRIKLIENYSEISKIFPNFVNITSQSFGSVLKINPLIQVTKYSKLIFDLSDISLSFIKNDISYPAFDFFVYTDNKFNNKFISTSNNKTNPRFNIKLNGIIGVTNDASLELDFDELTPTNLWYNLVPIDFLNNEIEKLDLVTDDNQFEFNKISVINSIYDGTYTISDVDTYTFKYSILDYPEIAEYNQLNSICTYFTNSALPIGPVNSVKLLNSNEKYSNIPTIKTIQSTEGKNCVLELRSKSIGNINSFEITDIGFDYPSDFTIRPKAKLPEIIKVEPLSEIDFIQVLSTGKNYNESPDLIMFDGVTSEIIDDIVLDFDLKQKFVKIIKNTKGINNVNPIIIPTNNTNGFEIDQIFYDESTKDVNLILSKQFSNSEDFPFNVGDKIFVENVSVGSTERGYNSEDYNYTLFTITSSNGSIGGSGAEVTFNLDSYLNEGENPGIYDNTVISGIVIPESYFPKFQTNLRKKTFSYQEEIVSLNSRGIVENWDEENEILKISTNQDFNVSEIISGQTSGTIARIKNINSFDGYYDLNSSSIVKTGWNRQTGFLNNEYQRIHDSDYYQYFSYSLKSHLSFNEWKNSVESLNHTVGFKKFSDLIVESYPINSGIQTNQNFGDFSGISDFYTEVNVNCVDDFDLVRENNIKFNNKLKSNEIYFEQKILQDYVESFGNKVLLIDDLSPQFNSNPRPTPFSIVDTFDVGDFRYRKYFIHIIDKRFSDESEYAVVSLLHDNSFGYLNQYGKIYTKNILGSFEFNIFGPQCNLLFYPNKFEINNYNLNYVSFDIGNIPENQDNISLGDIANITSQKTTILENSIDPINIITIDSQYRSLKIIVQISSQNSDYYEVDELNIIHDGNNVYISEYGQLTTESGSASAISGIGSYNSYINGSDLFLDIILNQENEVKYNINCLIFSISDQNSISSDIINIDNSYLKSGLTTLNSTDNPSLIKNLICSFDKQYVSSYILISIEDLDNNQYQLSELLVLYNPAINQSYYIEYGLVKTQNSLGKIESDVVGNNIEVYFTPHSNINCEVRILESTFGRTEDFIYEKRNGFSISSGYGFYTGTKIDIKKSFNLTYKNLSIFERTFDSNFVDIETNTIRIPENYFVTGEEVEYRYNDSTVPIEIEPINVVGIGITTELPKNVYIIKLDDLDIQVASSASEALSIIPNPIKIVGIQTGYDHKFISKKQNTKCLISIDNLIQSPVFSTDITTILDEDLGIFDNIVKVTGIGSFYGGDFIKINDEIMKVVSVGFGTTNGILVDRELLGTGLSTHNSSSIIRKIKGNYNIVDNILNFTEAPYGQVPVLNPSGRFDEVDYSGLEISSNFSGRVFLRSGISNSNEDSYSNNYIFDDISSNFSGYSTSFTLKSESLDVSGFSTSNSITLINDIFQLPSRFSGNDPSIDENYFIRESSGITTITFIGQSITNSTDVNTSTIPRGGIIVSLGSSQGFGYQPLVSAGGTVVVSSAGTIQSISIGNSGSGYRVGIQTIVNVGVVTESTDILNIEYVGIASIQNGHIVSVSITNPGSGYTSSNPPIVVFDDPLSYSNIPLIYSNSLSGLGTGAIIDIVVGQGSSIISFELKNSGFGYNREDVLTVDSGGLTGIPTNNSLNFEPFRITVDEIQNDKFSSWTFGDLQVLDSIDHLFDGVRKSFPLTFNGVPKSIKSRPGSNIDVQSTLLIFINDTLQVPGESYIFKGGSVITFKEAPKGPLSGVDGTSDTSKILFYRGTGDVDTVDVDILETVKVGDDLTISSDELSLKQRKRTVEQISSTDIVKTNLYFREGISDNELLVRPVKWCRQTEDKFVNASAISKDRILYEPSIYPNTNIIKTIDTNDDEIFVENIKIFFDNKRENNILNNEIIVISQEPVETAILNPIVSEDGSIDSIVVINGGVGYSTSPTIIISHPTNDGEQSTVLASLLNNSIDYVDVINSGSGYSLENPPLILVETPKIEKELISNISYEGDFGIIVGIKTVSVGLAETGITFDFYIPENSFIRDQDVNNVGTALTGISGIKTDYYFVISNSNVGNGLISLDKNGDIIGYSENYIDGIYQAISVSIASTSVLGVGVTNVIRTTVSVSDYNNLSGIGISNFYGNYSWGRISDLSRNNPKQFISYKNGISGIETSPIIIRKNPLKYSNYI
jgi:hypothetical protein